MTLILYVDVMCEHCHRRKILNEFNYITPDDTTEGAYIQPLQSRRVTLNGCRNVVTKQQIDSKLSLAEMKHHCRI